MRQELLQQGMFFSAIFWTDGFQNGSYICAAAYIRRGVRRASMKMTAIPEKILRK